MLYVAQIFCSLLTIFLCVLPYFLSWRLQFPKNRASNAYAIEIAINSTEYLLSLVSSASMSFHMIVDIFGHSVFSRGYIYSYRNFYSKILIIFSLLTHCGGGVWRSHTLLYGLVGIQSGFVLKYYLYFQDANAFSSLVFIAIALQTVGLLLTALITYRWCTQIYQNIAEGKKLTSDEYCCNIYLLGFVIVGSALAFQSSYYRFPNWFDLNTSMAVGENCYFTVFYVLITVFEGHAVQMEAITSQVMRISEMHTYYTLLYCYFTLGLFISV